jgi:peroxiredoxin
MCLNLSMFNTKALISFLFLLVLNFNYSQESVPNTTIVDFNKKGISTNLILQDGKYYVLSFWATWCIPCINELDAIADNYKEWTDNGIEIIAISTDDSRTKKRVRPMVNGKNWNFKILLDENHDFKRALNIDGIPHTVVTKGKQIISRRVGYSPGEEVDLLDSIIEYKSINE